MYRKRDGRLRCASSHCICTGENKHLRVLAPSMCIGALRARDDRTGEDRGFETSGRLKKNSCNQGSRAAEQSQGHIVADRQASVAYFRWKSKHQVRTQTSARYSKRQRQKPLRPHVRPVAASAGRAFIRAVEAARQAMRGHPINAYHHQGMSRSSANLPEKCQKHGPAAHHRRAGFVCT